MKKLCAILLFLFTMSLSCAALAAESASDSSAFKTTQQKTKDADSDESGVNPKGPYHPQGQAPDSGGMYQPKGYNSGVPGKVIDNNGYGYTPPDAAKAKPGKRTREETGTMGGFGPSGPPDRTMSPGTGARDMNLGTPAEPSPSTTPSVTPGSPSGSARTPAGPSPTSTGPSDTSPSGNR